MCSICFDQEFELELISLLEFSLYKELGCVMCTLKVLIKGLKWLFAWMCSSNTNL